MNLDSFKKELNSETLAENIEKLFDVSIDLTKYSREQLEDARNKIRTRIFQYEGSSKINELLTNEEYQKDKAMLELLNTRIKEMLGEQMKSLKDKLDQLNEAKKAKKDYDGDGKIESPKDEVWGSRAKAAAKAGKPFGKKAQENLEKRSDGHSRSEYDANLSLSKDDSKDASSVNDFFAWRADKDSKKKGVSNKTIGEKAVSKAQQQAAGVALAAKKAGKTPPGKGAAAQMAKMPKKELEKFAGTKHKGLPKHKKADEAVGEELLPKQKAVAKKILDKDMANARADRAAKKQAGTMKHTNESFRKNVELVNESLIRLIKEDEEGKAKAITAASDMVNDFTSWMQRVGQYQTKSMIELADAIRADFGQQESEAFKSAVAPALAATLETLTQQRETLSNAVAVLAGEAAPSVPMGTEPVAPQEPGIDTAAPDELNPADELDVFAASDAAAGAGTTGREVREGVEERAALLIAEQHSIIARLAK